MSIHRDSGWRRMLVSSALLIVFLACCWGGWYLYERAWLAAAWERAELAGIPRDVYSLPPEPLPAEDDAAALLTDRELMRFFVESRGLPTAAREEGYVAGLTLSEKRRVLEQFAQPTVMEQMALIEDATRRPGFNLSWEKHGPEAPILHRAIWPLDIVRLRLELRADTGQASEAIKDAIRLVRLLELMALEPLHEVQLQRYQVGASLPPLLSRISNHASEPLPEAALRELRDAIGRSDNALADPALEQALAFEISLLRHHLYRETSSSGALGVVIRGWLPGVAGEGALFDSPLRYHLYRDLARPLYLRDEAIFLDRLVQLRQEWTDGVYAESQVSPPPRYARIAREAWAYFDAPMEERAAAYVAGLRVSSTALAILERYGLDGPFPDVPDLLADMALPANPYNGQPLHYLPLAGGFAVWCNPPGETDTARIAWYHRPSAPTAP